MGSLKPTLRLSISFPDCYNDEGPSLVVEVPDDRAVPLYPQMLSQRDTSNMLLITVPTRCVNGNLEVRGKICDWPGPAATVMPANLTGPHKLSGRTENSFSELCGNCRSLS